MDNEECKNILFGYLNEPAYGEDGDDGGFSVTLYKDRRLVYKTYLFEKITKMEEIYKISGPVVSAIKNLLRRQRKAINAFDSNLDADTFDGSANIFVFDEKRIVVWNIEHTPPLFFPFVRDDLLVAVMKQENQILSLFGHVSKILKKDGIDLSLEAVSFCKRSLDPPWHMER